MHRFSLCPTAATLEKNKPRIQTANDGIVSITLFFTPDVDKCSGGRRRRTLFKSPRFVIGLFRESGKYKSVLLNVYLSENPTGLILQKPFHPPSNASDNNTTAIRVRAALNCSEVHFVQITWRCLIFMRGSLSRFFELCSWQPLYNYGKI